MARTNKLYNRFKRFSDRWELEQVIEALNGKNRNLAAKDRDALVHFVELWNEAKRNPHNSPLYEEVLLEGHRFSLGNLARAFSWRLVAVPSQPWDPAPSGRFAVGGAAWRMFPNVFHDLAVRLASTLLSNPLRGHLSDGPCHRSACQRWFYKKRPEQNACGQKCLGIVRAAEQNKRERSDRKRESLKRASCTLRAWTLTDRSEYWKDFVSRKTRLSKKFLTRSVNPQKERETGELHAALLKLPAAARAQERKSKSHQKALLARLSRV